MKKEGSLSRILDAAIRVFAENGLTGTTLEAVAAAAGLTSGLTHYFRSKEDLVCAMLRRMEERLTRERDEIAATLPETPSRLARATMMTVAAPRRFFDGATTHVLDLLDVPAYAELVSLIKRRIVTDLVTGARDPARVHGLISIMDGMWLHCAIDHALLADHPERDLWKWLAEQWEDVFRNYESA
ncbi:MAG: TetR/AcrR family transcriptional regulator [Planctomycetes bacterium]|nr:TetR/AcrR family transcriptional regulator [Planctomycetota bacterium]MCC8115864.1 TetR/AcrR family transcriptional regulator [Planctomycetota bacterium]MCD7896165.1 TetR/AcrR family transcriptional regulator [Planctomycetaceae bacterium]